MALDRPRNISTSTQVSTARCNQAQSGTPAVPAPRVCQLRSGCSHQARTFHHFSGGRCFGSLPELRSICGQPGHSLDELGAEDEATPRLGFIGPQPIAEARSASRQLQDARSQPAAPGLRTSSMNTLASRSRDVWKSYVRYQAACQEVADLLDGGFGRLHMSLRQVLRKHSVAATARTHRGDPPWR